MIKPTVKIRNASVAFGRLYGITDDYPKEHMGYEGCVTPGHTIQTSKIVKQDGDVIETERTIYNVTSWETV